MILAITAFAALLWPAVINGQPFFFPDTTTYIRGAAYPVEKLFGVQTTWSVTTATLAGKPAAAKPSLRATPLSSIEDKTVLAGRSVYYGALVLLGHLLGGFWLTVIAQAAVVGSAVFMTLRAYSARPAVATALALATLGIATPLPFFAGYLMPDVFAGLTILSIAMLIGARDKLNRSADMFWVCVLAYALLCHSSHVAVAVGLLAVAGISALVFPALRAPRGFALVGVALGVALAGDIAFAAAVSKVSGAPPIRPPFLTARVMASSAGVAYLKAACPEQAYAVCSHIDRAPIGNTDFLWNPHPDHGVFAPATAKTRRTLADEQTRIFIGAFVHMPWESTKTVLAEWAQQIHATGIAEFNYGNKTREDYAAKMPSDVFDTLRDTRAGHEIWPVTRLELLFSVTLSGSLALLLLMRSWQGTARRDTDLLIAMVLLGVALNALVCSALSGVEGRYQARVIWLVPFMTLLLALHRESPLSTWCPALRARR